MKKVTVQVEDYLYDFYRKVGQQAGGIAVEKVMADTLFWMRRLINCATVLR